MNIQDLPDLALFKVLSFLGNEEKIKRLVLVSKSWYSFCQTDLQQLAIYQRRPPQRLFWNAALSQKEIDEQFIVRTKTLNKKFAIKFRNLKKLLLFKISSYRVFLSSLNEGSLNQLVELTVISSLYPAGNSQIPEPKLKAKINLPSLKKLCSNHGPFFEEISAPNLE